MTGRRAPVVLSARRRRLVYFALSGLWLSGAIWLILHTFFQRNGDFGSTPHPLTPVFLMIHAAFALLALIVFGLVWGVHIAPAWRRGHRRVTGLATVALVAALSVTGYVLYYAGNENVRALTSIVHWLIGLLAIVPFLVHVLVKVDPASRPRRSDS